MKSRMKILSRYVLSATGVALILLALNFLGLATWIVQTGKIRRKDYSVSQLADGLTKSDGVYTLSAPAQEAIQTSFQWAMLLNDDGAVIWDMNLPGDVPRQYTVSDVASFSHWYLKDYPVYVWQHPDGLFVLGSKEGSVWKHAIELPQQVMEKTLVWIPALLLANGMVAVLLALLFGLRLFRSLRPLVNGMEDMAEQRPVTLSTRGLLGDLAARINQTSEQLTKQEAALRKRDTARTTWIAGVSHDIRTPLSMVMGYSSQLEHDPALPPSKQEQAGIIRKQSERMKALINDLNLASKLEYDMQPLRKSEFSVAALLRSVAADFLNSGRSDRYSIEVCISESAQNASIYGDEALIKRAVSNLLSNSIRHNPDGCAITVTLETDGTNCSLSVSDNGIGFTQELLKTLTQPKRAAPLENHGLGLTIVRQIIKAHRGTTQFRNLPEGGCTVLLCLPLPVSDDSV